MLQVVGTALDVLSQEGSEATYLGEAATYLCAEAMYLGEAATYLCTAAIYLSAVAT